MLDIPHSDLVFFPLEHEGVLFNQSTQNIIALNSSAAFLWCSSYEVNTKVELENLYANHFSVGLPIAKRDIKQFFHTLKNSLQPLPSEPSYKSFIDPIEPIKKLIDPKAGHKDLFLTVNGKTLSISLQSDNLKHELARVFNAFNSTPNNTSLSAQTNIHVTHAPKSTLDSEERFDIYINKLCVLNNAPFNGVIPNLFGIVFETSYNATISKSPTPLMFHAAALSSTNGKTLLFPAESGSGKSTLAAALNAHNWKYHTDELAIIDAEHQQLFPHPFPICIKDGAVEFLTQYYPDIEKAMHHHRLDDKWVRYQPIATSDDLSTPIPINALVFPTYLKNEPCALNVIDKQEALKRLLQCGSSGRPITVQEMKSIVHMVEKQPCYSLRYSDIDKAINALENV